MGEVGGCVDGCLKEELLCGRISLLIAWVNKSSCFFFRFLSSFSFSFFFFRGISQD